jgi:hypothetical protein
LKLNILSWHDVNRERPVSAVPRLVVSLFVIALLLQILWHTQQSKPVAKATELSTAPSLAMLKAFSLGDPVSLSRLLMLRIQSFDSQPGISIPFSKLDYEKVVSWLGLISGLDPNSQYPYLIAARVYAQVQVPDKKRIMLNFVHEGFLQNPDLQWPAMVHAVFIAKHRLEDLELALKYAKDIRLHVKRDDIPSWVRQMELFVLEEMGDLESARVLLGGFLESGLIESEREFRFLQDRLGATDSN